MESEKPFYDDISAAIQRLPEVLQKDDAAEYRKYEALLNSLGKTRVVLFDRDGNVLWTLDLDDAHIVGPIAGGGP